MEQHNLIGSFLCVIKETYKDLQQIN